MRGIMESVIEDSLYGEMDNAFEAVLDMAMEAEHVISKEERDNLPEDAFGLPVQRKYPLIIYNNKTKTEESIRKAIQFFHYCKGENRAELARNIVRAIQKSGVNVKIGENSTITKYTNVPDELILKPAKSAS